MTSRERNHKYPIIGIRFTEAEYKRLKMYALYNGKTAQKALKDAFFRSDTEQLPIGRPDAQKLQLELASIGNYMNMLLLEVSERADEQLRRETARMADEFAQMKDVLGGHYGRR